MNTPPTLLTAPLLLGLCWVLGTPGTGPGSISGPAATAESAALAPLRDADCAALLAEYQAALARWTEAYDAAADTAARRTLRESHPARSFRERFEALAPNEPQAALWLIENAGHAGLRGSAARELKAAQYARLFAAGSSLDAAWVGEALVGLARDRSSVGEEAFGAYLTRVAAESTVPEHRARALFVHGDWLAGRDEPERRAAGVELLRRAATEFQSTSAGAEAAERLFVIEHLSVGAVAPDFVGRTVDGAEFRLSEQRGKVVVLDFFGFW
jgi:hypothetical protein